jgi:transcriptional regulator with XRE-family HTH domain
LYETRRYLAFPQIRTVPIDFLFKKSEHVCMTLTDYRMKHGLTLEQFGVLVGKSKAQIHAIEKGNYATAKLALAIEQRTGGEVDAAFLNPQIAQARRAVA